MFSKIEADLIEKNKQQCAFLVIYCREGRPYVKYTQNNEMDIPMVLTINRHDGYIGFVGGKVESDEMLLQGLYREVLEEIGYKIDILRVKPLITFSDGKTDIHSFKYEVSYKELMDIAFQIFNADHFGIEITGFALNHIVEYCKEGGINQLRKQNWKETGLLELEELINQEFKEETII